jgi:ferredoxin
MRATWPRWTPPCVPSRRRPWRSPASFAAQADKRATLDLALDHLLAQAPRRPKKSPAGRRFALGSLQVDTERCTLCLSCVGACPEAALADNPDKPQLRFIESKCVQCGLCATTCPENAITLQPRLWLADGGKARKAAAGAGEQEPYRCIQCGKPFGTLRAIENMLSKLSGHAAFQGAAAERLKMCSDCRVIDIYTNPNEVRITDL